MAQWLHGTVVENQHWTETLFSLRLEVEPVEFVAGQFIKLALNLGDKRIARPYSLVNPPGGYPVECYLVLVPAGLLSPSLHHLQKGDVVLVSYRACAEWSVLAAMMKSLRCRPRIL